VNQLLEYWKGLV